MLSLFLVSLLVGVPWCWYSLLRPLLILTAVRFSFLMLLSLAVDIAGAQGACGRDRMFCFALVVISFQGVPFDWIVFVGCLRC